MGNSGQHNASAAFISVENDVEKAG